MTVTLAELQAIDLFEDVPEVQLRPWLDARGPNVSALQRFQRLLDEPLTPAVIQDELSSVG